MSRARSGQGNQDRRACRCRPLQPPCVALCPFRAATAGGSLRHGAVPPGFRRPEVHALNSRVADFVPSSAPPTVYNQLPRRSRPWRHRRCHGDTAPIRCRARPALHPRECTRAWSASRMPDTALPNTSQDLSTLLTTAVSTTSPTRRQDHAPPRAAQNRVARRPAHVGRDQDRNPAAHILRESQTALKDSQLSPSSSSFDIIAKVPWLQKVTPSSLRRSARIQAQRRLLHLRQRSLQRLRCCVTACGDPTPPQVAETEEVNAEHETAPASLTAPRHFAKVLGLFNSATRRLKDRDTS